MPKESIPFGRTMRMKVAFCTSTLVAVSGFVNPDALIEISALAAKRMKN